MRFKFFLLPIVLCLCFTACGEERIQGVLYDAIVPPAEVQTELPPEVWESVKRVAPLIMFGDPILDDPERFEQFTSQLKAYYNRYINGGGVAIIGNEAVADKYFHRCRKATMVLTSKHPYLQEWRRSPLKKTFLNRDSWYLQNFPPEKYDVQIPFYITIHPANVGEDYYSEMPPELVVYAKSSPDGVLTFPGSCSYHFCYADIKPPHAYVGPGIRTFVHEFGHVLDYVISRYDPEFRPKLSKAYKTALELATWKGQYAEKNSAEYWAEGVEFWYLQIGAMEWHRAYRIPAFESYEAFADHDPLLFELLDEWLPRYSLAIHDFESYDEHIRNPNWR